MGQDPLDKFKKRPDGQGTFGEAKSEPSWFRRAMQAGFKKFKENPDEHTMAAIELDDINQAKSGSDEKMRPSWRDQAPLNGKPGFSHNNKELTGFRRMSHEFLAQEEQRKKARAQAVKRGAGNLGQYDSGAFGIGAKGRLVMLAIMVGFGFVGYRVTRRWVETSDSLMAKMVAKKIELVTGKKITANKKPDIRDKTLERDQQLKASGEE